MVTDPGRQEADPRRPAHSAPPRPPARHVRPFTRLARTHAMSAAGDGAVAIALAGSLFFSLDYEAARWRVVLYLVLTLLPFTVVAPLIGPAIDRLKNSAISKVVITNTVPLPPEKQIDKIEVLSVARIIADALDAVFGDASVSEIFGGENQA